MHMPLKKSNLTTMGKTFADFFLGLAQFLVTASETELDHYHQKVNARAGLRIAEQRKL